MNEIENLKNKIKVDKNNCWLWTGSMSKTGYGKTSLNGKYYDAHKAFYIAFKGPVEKGYELDHLCRVRNCVNPAHLEPVTHKENMNRAIFENDKKTHCPKGHKYSHLNSKGARVCRICLNEAALRYSEKNREKINENRRIYYYKLKKIAPPSQL